MRRRLGKRILSVFLSLRMLCFVLPVSAEESPSDVLSGASDSAEQIETQSKPDKPEGELLEITSGYCGDNLQWRLDTDTGILTISGTGKMHDYSLSSTAPWHGNASIIKQVRFEEGVTRIGNYAFYECRQLTSMTIPSKITEIGNYAFKACSGLSDVTVPNSVTKIGASAFSECSGLTRIAIPDSVVQIGSGAFRDCNGLTDITIPNSVTEIGDSIFSNCGSLASVVIPVGVTKIGSSAFYGCSSLKNVTIPDGVISIGDSAYQSCSNLTKITVPSSITQIGDSAFHLCTLLKDVYYKGSEDQWKQLIFTIGNNNTSFTKATIHYPTPEPEPELKPDFSGTCGDKLTWGLYLKTGQLIISGTGNMRNYSDENVPWYEHRSDIKQVSIGQGIISIGAYAFYECSSLTSVTIPDSVITIGGHAFNGCSSLTSVTIPNSVTNIGNYVFAHCSGLTSVTIPNSVTNIGNYAFVYCSSLTSVTIPDNVTSIGDYAFEYCSSLMSVTIPNSTTSIGNYAFHGCSSLTSVTVPDSVTSIGYAAFENCSSLTSVTIPDSVTSIGDYTFMYCSSLTSVTIPISITQIGDSAFSQCTSLSDVYYKGSEEQWKKVTIGSNNDYFFMATIHYPDPEPGIARPDPCGENLIWRLDLKTGILTISGTGDMYDYDDKDKNAPWYSDCSAIKQVNIGQGVTSIGDYAFYFCENLVSVTISDSVTHISDYAFFACSSLSSVNIPTGVSFIGESAFSSCSNLTSISIPNSVTQIGKFAFADCTSLTSVTISNSLAEITWGAFAFCDALANVTIPAGVKKIGDHAFSDCTSLTSIVIPEGVTSIGDLAFYGCSGLISVTIPDSLAELGDSVFFGCSSLTDITIPDSVTKIGAGVFNSCSSLTNMRIPAGITTINNAMFGECNNLTYIVIPESVTKINYRAFYKCNSLKDVYYAGNSDKWKAITIDSDNDPLKEATLHCPSLGPDPDPKPDFYGTCGEHLTWALYKNTGLLTISGTGNMRNYSDENVPWYRHRSDIKQVNIGQGVTSIGDYAFYNCSSLTSVTIPDSVTTIGHLAFQHCSNLTSVTIPNSVTSIGYVAFSGCSSLTSVTIGNSVTSISDGAFFECSNLTSVTIPDSVTSIREFAFDGCSSLTSVTISDSVTSIGDGAFRGCSSLTSVTIPDSVTSIGAVAFRRCSSLTSIDMGKSVTSIVYAAFADCSSLTSVTIPDSVTSIGEGAFQECSSLTRVTIGNSVTSIGEGAFKDCSSLKDVRYAGKEKQWNAITIGTGNEPLTKAPLHIEPDFSGTCGANLTWELYIDSGKLVISGTGDMENYSSPSKLAKWYDHRLQIKQVEIGQATNIGNYAFYNCSNLSGITIPDSVTEIGASAFEGCSNLASIVIPDSVTKISNHAFNKCSKLGSIAIPNSVTSIDNGAFQECNGLTNVTIPNGVKEISARVFSGCGSLSSITLPDDITKIGEGAFFNCRSLTNVTIPDKVTFIEASAFQDCHGLTKVIILNSVIQIGNSAFRNCNSLSDVYYIGTKTQWDAIEIGDDNAPLTDATIHYNYIPDKLTVTVTWDASTNGGTVNGQNSTTTDVTAGKTATPPGNTPVKTGHSFKDWYTSASGGNLYSTVSITAARTFYAQFTANQYTITWDINDGSGSHTTSKQTYGTNLTLPDNPSETGRTFNGWFTAATDGSQVTASTTYDTASDTTYYAHWLYPKTYNVTYDAYSFGNNANAFGYTSTAAGQNTYPIQWSTVRYIFGNTVKGKSVYKEMVLHDWNGNCCGMASTSALMFADPQLPEQFIGSNDVHSLKPEQNLGELDVKTFIEAMQVAQYADQFSEAFNNNRLYPIQLSTGKTLDALCDAVRSDMAAGGGTVIAIGKEGLGGHALLAYDLKDNGANLTMSIYDCNYPLQDRSVTLTKSSSGTVTGWSYDMGGYGIWGSADPYCYISYIPFQVIHEIWENRGHLFGNRVLLQVNSENISITDFEKQVVAEIQNGKLVTDSEEIFEVPNLSLTSSPVRAVYLPKDYYTVTSADEGEFEVSMSDIDRGATVLTTAKSVSLSVDDDSRANSVIIKDATVSDRYTVSLEMPSASGSTVTYDNVTISGTGKGESIGISNNLGILSISNCNVESFTVNGEQQLYYTITASAGKGGKITPEGDQKVAAEKSCTFNFIPDDGYKVEYVQVDNANIGARESYTFSNVGKDHVIMVEFSKQSPQSSSINSVSFDRSTRSASVDVSCDSPATLISALYDQSGAMLSVAAQEINKSGTVSFSFNDIALPEKFTVKVFMLDNTYAPLCKPYEKKI